LQAFQVLAALLADYWQKTTKRIAEKWRFAEVDISGARNNFGGYCNAPNHRLSTVHNHLCIVTWQI
jgi:hypothetical protein